MSQYGNSYRGIDLARGGPFEKAGGRRIPNAIPAAKKESKDEQNDTSDLATAIKLASALLTVGPSAPTAQAKPCLDSWTTHPALVRCLLFRGKLSFWRADWFVVLRAKAQNRRGPSPGAWTPLSERGESTRGEAPHVGRRTEWGCVAARR